MDSDNEKLIVATRNAVSETEAADVVAIENDTIAPGWYMLFTASVLLIVFSLITVTQKQIIIAQQGAYAAAIVANLEEEQLEIMLAKKQPFEELQVEAQSAVVYDLVNEEVLYERNPTLRMPLASLTKLMTALVASQYFETDDTISIRYEDTLVDGISGFYLGERWRFKDLVDYTLVTSSNDGAMALARSAGEQMLSDGVAGTDPIAVFVDEMNDVARHIGMYNTTYTNPTGLDIDDRKGGAYGTVGDIQLLLAHIMQEDPQLFAATKQNIVERRSINNFIHTASNTNPFVEELPGLRASKTGYTDLAGGNLATVFDTSINTPVIIVVLGSSIDGRFADTDLLYWAALESVSGN